MHEVTTKGLLFDMDGTLLDSTPAVEATWRDFSERHGLDLTMVLQTTHGVRTIDNLRRLSGITDEGELKLAVDAFENGIASEAQELKAQGKDGLILLPGVDELLKALVVSQSPVWAIVTSATAIYAAKALPTAGVPKPPFLITGDMCDRGKPDPEPYLRGAKALGLDISDCVVVEDAPAGVRSGVAAGCRVLAVCTSHSRSALENLGAAWIVSDLTRVRARLGEDGIHLSIDEN